MPSSARSSGSLAHYFIRANGDTLHGNPSNGPCYIPNEPPGDGRKRFNHVPYCLTHGIARIGWPDVGDLRHVPAKVGAAADCYDFNSTRLTPNVRRYLQEFKEITVGSVVLLPDSDRPGILYIGTVRTGYAYTYAPPEHPYECAHQVSVAWDKRNGVAIEYTAADLGINIRGGFWRRAFHRIEVTQKRDLIHRIEAARNAR